MKNLQNEKVMKGVLGKSCLAIILISVISGCGAIHTGEDNGNGSENGLQSRPTYHLGPNDTVRIQVFGEGDLTTETKINGQGRIRFPLLGDLVIGGMTVQEAEEFLTNQLKQGYLIDPKVTFHITQYRNFFVHGEARSPGAYPYREGLTLLKAITLAGGFTVIAAKGRVHVIREENGEETVFNPKMDELIHPDDIIIIPESFF
jgi:polysaccharide export outer membrane protein